jgi:hypothetical protein
MASCHVLRSRTERPRRRRRSIARDRVIVVRNALTDPRLGSNAVGSHTITKTSCVRSSASSREPRMASAKP